MKFHFGTSSWGGTRKLPYAFTENGVAMISSVLNSKLAIHVNIQIMRTFTRLREILLPHKDLARKLVDMEKKYDAQLIYPAAETAGNLMQGNYFIFIRSLTPWQDHGEYARYPFKIVFDAIRQLMKPDEPKKKPIGFRREPNK